MSLASHFLARARAGLGHLDGHQLRRRQGALPGAGARSARGCRRRGEIVDAKEVPGGVQATTRITIEREGGDKPVAIVDTIAGTWRERGRERVSRRAASGPERPGAQARAEMMTSALTRSGSTARSRSSPARGRGIGAAIARAFAEAGADVVLAARTKEQLDEVAAEVRASGREARRDPDRRQRQRRGRAASSRRRVDELGRIDIVVNNAGGTMPRPFMDTSPGFLERVVPLQRHDRVRAQQGRDAAPARERRRARSSTSRRRSAGCATAASSPTAPPRPRSRT